MGPSIGRIIEHSEEISRTGSVDEVVDVLARLLRRTVKSRWVAVYLLDRERRDFLPALVSGLADRYLPLFQDTLLRPGSIPLIRDLLRKRQHMLITDTRNSELLPPIFRRLLRHLSLLAIPMVARNQVIGAVFVTRSLKYPPFSEEEIAIIREMVSYAALTASHIQLFDESLELALDNARHYEEMRALFISTVSTLANAIDAKSAWTKGHSERVMQISATIAREMGLPEERIERIKLAGLLHDIGKIGIIEALLEKPALLSEDEFPPMRLHPGKGVAILAPIEQLTDILPGILSHHERIDGTGYPSGLKGDEIPLEARIIAVADSFDAMVSERPYKSALSPLDALSELELSSGSQFDSQVVSAFCSHLRRTLSMPQ